MGKALILAVALFVAGCVHTGPVENPRAVWCENNSPRRPSEATVNAMSRQELDEMNTFNAKGAAWCGWKP